MVEKINSKMTVTTKMPSSWAKSINGRSQDISIFAFERHLSGHEDKYSKHNNKKKGDKNYRFADKGSVEVTQIIKCGNSIGDRKDNLWNGNKNANLIDIVV
jgi:hypothetical protein